MDARQKLSPHSLDGCDEDKCYEVMMAERSVLITARRESEDNLIKTIIQISSALIALMAGFISQTSFILNGIREFLFSASIGLLGIAIIAGLSEQFFSSKAYEEQQRMLEDFYGKYIDDFSDAPSNKNVRRAQVASFVFFVLSLGGLAAFAIVEAGGKTNVEQRATSTPTAATTAATTASTTSSTTAAAAAAAAG